MDQPVPNADGRRGAAEEGGQGAGRADGEDTPKVMWKREAHMRYVASMKHDVGYASGSADGGGGGSSKGKGAPQAVSARGMQAEAVGPASPAQTGALDSRAEALIAPTAAPASAHAAPVDARAPAHVDGGSVLGGVAGGGGMAGGARRGGVKFVGVGRGGERLAGAGARTGSGSASYEDSFSITSGVEEERGTVGLEGAGGVDLLEDGRLDSDEERLLAEKFFQVT